MCSATGAPGVTTTVLATGWLWPSVHDRSVVVVDADPAGGGTTAGLLRAELPHGTGVLGLAARNVPVEPRDLERECLALGDSGRSSLVPGVADPLQAAQLGQVWWALSEISVQLDAAGTDVLVDAGRLGHANEPITLLRRAEVVAIVLRATLRSVVGATAAIRRLRDVRGRGAGLVTVLVAGGGNYSVAEVENALDVDHVVEVPRDPRTASIFSGQAPGAPSSRSPLMTSARDVARGLTAPLDVLGRVAR